MTTPTRQHAFTIMELIVAISVAGLMVLMINVLFNESVRAVNLGAGTSRVLQQSHTINTQLEKDFGIGASDVLFRNSLSVNPSADRDETGDHEITVPARVGTLMIVYHQIENADAATDESGEVYLLSGERRNAFFPDDTDGNGDADVRSDQLLFLRNTYDGERPLTPQSTDALGNDNEVDAALIWYGHLQPTNDRGTEANDDPTVTDSTDPDFYDFYRRPANQWILGRQARYFSVNALESGTPLFDADDIRLDPDVNATGGGPQRGLSDGSAMPSPIASTASFLQLGFANSEVAGITSAPSDIEGSNSRGYHGLTDLIPANAEELFHDEGAAGSVTDTAGPLGASRPDTDYASAAASIAYLYDRLWVNPRPHDAAGNPARLLEAWQQAQMHPYLAAGVSDFEVHFAGDYDDNTDPSDTPTSFDGRIDLDSDGNIRWYNSNVSSQNNLDVTGTADADIISPPDKAAVSGVDPTQVPIQRFGTDFSVTPGHGTLVYVFRHDQPQSWPDLIRIRYRIHDADGRISDRQLDTSTPPDGIPDENIAVPGRVVEIILRVPG